MQTRQTKKLLSLLLTLCLMLGMVPVTAAIVMPELTPVSAIRTGETTATVTFSSNVAGTFYYIAYDARTVVMPNYRDGTPVSLVQGENTLQLSGFTSALAQKVYLRAFDTEDWYGSDPLDIFIPAYLAPGRANVTLAVKQNGTGGYQMLLDADTTACETILNDQIFGNWPVASGDIPTSIYDQFEYKIPANADGAVSTANAVFDGLSTIEVDAGTYDIGAPNPNADHGTVYLNRCWDAYTIEAGTHHLFFGRNNSLRAFQFPASDVDAMYGVLGLGNEPFWNTSWGGDSSASPLMEIIAVSTTIDTLSADDLWLLPGVTAKLSTVSFAAASAASVSLGPPQTDTDIYIVTTAPDGLQRYCVLTVQRSSPPQEGDSFLDNTSGLRFQVMAMWSNQPGGSLSVVPDDYQGVRYTVPASLIRAGLPFSVIQIGADAFAGVTSLREITFPASLSGIWERAFQDCTGLSVLTFPATLYSIGEQAFQNCTSLSVLTFLGSEPRGVVGSSFGNVPPLLVVVPTGLQDAYETALGHYFPTGSVIVEAAPGAACWVRFETRSDQPLESSFAATNENGQLSTLPTPTREGWTFDGWYTQSVGGTPVTTDTVFVSNTAIYARWTEDVNPIYRVTFNPNGGAALSPSSALTNENDRLATLPTPTREGWTFNGWYTHASGGTLVTTDTVFAADTTIYAQWTENSGGGTGTGTGGGGGGGGGGGSTEASTVTAGDGSVPVNAKQSGDTVTLDLPTSKVTEILEASEDGVAQFDLTKAYGATSAALPASAVSRLANADLALELRLPQGTVTLAPGVLSTAVREASGKDVSVSLKKVNHSSLTEAQRAAVKSGDLVLDITLTAGGTAIQTLNGMISVTVPYNGELPVAVWYLDDAGVLEKLDCTYDAATKTVTFVTDHLSLYILGQDAPPPQRSPFTDVRVGDWYYEAALYAYENGLMSGTGNNQFSPNLALTRGMAVTVLYRMAGSPDVSGLDSSFTDVTAGQYYADAVKWAAEHGIVSGYGGGIFAPDQNIRRQDLALILTRYAAQAGVELPAARAYADFADQEAIADYARDAVEQVCRAEIAGGKPGNLFDPNGMATRAEFATMLQKLLAL